MKPEVDSGTDGVLHITVAVGPSVEFDLTSDLNMLKAALLYADKVKLCSFSSSGLVWLERLETGGMVEVLDSIVQFYHSMRSGKVKARLSPVIRDYKSRRSRLVSDIRRRGYRREQMEPFRENLRQLIEELAGEAAKGLTSALDSGRVELEFLDVKSRRVAERYFSAVADAVASGTTYPLLDDTTSHMIESAIKEARIVPLGASIDRAKQVGLPSRLFARLPLFDKASIDEIIDIGRELEGPLARFRSAMIEFSQEIEGAPWSKSFSLEAEKIYYKYVEPAVLDIEEACKSRRFLLELITKSIEAPEVWLAGLVLLVDAPPRAGLLPDLLGGILLASGAGGTVIKVAKEWRERNEEIEKNQLYFYYKVKSSLSN